MAGWAETLGRSSLEVAPDLLGSRLRHRTAEGTVTVRITEVEAYAGVDDPGSHAYRGPTARNEVMFGPPGHLYVYFTYGMHHCCNVVVGGVGTAAAVLLRAGEVVEGEELARSRRPRATARDLARGPARLCTALGIDRRHNRADLSTGDLTLELSDPVDRSRIGRGPRVGLREAADRPWRFWLLNEPTVSTYRPASPRRSRSTARCGREARLEGSHPPPTREGTPVPQRHDILDDLEWRGLIAHSTDLDALRAEMEAAPVRFYVGFDPTAPSLHLGNLVQVLTARRLQDAGHVPFALVGGATGLIGDPRESGERTMNPVDTVREWVGRVRRQIEPFLSFEGDNAATMVDNYDWTSQLSAIDFLRDVGKHFPVNRMLARDVVRSRLESGISYTEFSYVLLQSMDFLELYRTRDVRLQFGGSDQWGNLTGGVELIRRSAGGRAHAFATPLVTKADGTKYGKTEGGALWLDPTMLSPYAFYQFWLNVEDVKVGELLRIFTFLPREEIEELERQTAEKPFLRAGQKALASEVTTLVHGAAETQRIQAASAALFGGGDLATLDPTTLGAALAEAGGGELARGADLPTIVDLLVAAGLSESRGAARRTVSEGGAYLNNRRVSDPDERPSEADLVAGRWLVLRRGKKSIAGVRLV